MTRKRKVDYLPINKVAIHCCSAVASSLGAVTDKHAQYVTHKHIQNVTERYMQNVTDMHTTLG